MQISMPSLYRVRRADIPACAALAARAFAFDASLRFQMGGREPSFRKRKLFFQVMLLSWWQTGELFATSNALEGIICFSAGESDGIPMRAFLRAGGWKLPLAVHPLIFRNIRRYEAQNAAMRSSKGGARGAWALNLLAVDPARQGRGYGAAMMRALTSELDRQNARCYLETEKPANLPFYERFGFFVTGESEKADGVPSQYGMLRNPRSEI